MTSKVTFKVIHKGIESDSKVTSKVTPNVEIRTAGATSAVFFIRGVGLADFSANAAGAVAIYQDDVPINAPAMRVILPHS